ncbi:MAG: outer membrane protein assembly factor BamE [Gammaproteobacteria bacterium]|jgi:uncharacterized membrane protein|nr:outer membrane protein assembly factor BamE [Gammaproteobacteria bacterium]
MKKLLIILGCLALTACSKLTVENYDKLTMGMTYQQVTDIIGSPVSCDEVIGTRTCQWGDDTANVHATFISDKAIAFTHKGLK